MVVYVAGTGYIDSELALFATGAMFAAPDPAALLQRLRGWGVDHLLVTRTARPWPPGDPETWPGVRRVYSDEHADVFALDERIAALTPADAGGRANRRHDTPSSR